MLLTVGWVLLLITNVAILVFGTLVAVYPPIASPYDENLLRALGMATIGMGLFGTAISVAPFRRKEKWAWLTLWYMPVFWIVHLVARLPPGNDRVHQFVLVVMSVLGLMLPVKDFFPRRSAGESE